LTGNSSSCDTLRNELVETKSEVKEVQEQVQNINETIKDKPKDKKSSQVEFKVGNKSVVLSKYSQKRGHYDKVHKPRLDEASQLLKDNGLTVSSTNLRKLGFGAELCTKYLNTQ
jgi:predicted  nucleic acid-binding Zn-ribbon protein